MKHPLLTLCSALLTLSLAGGPHAAPLTIDADKQKSVTLTLYNQDLGLIRDERSIPRINPGQTLYIKDVSHQMMSETLRIEQAGQIIEQNLNTNLISAHALLQAYTGKTLQLARINPATGQESLYDITLLSVAGADAVIQSAGLIETIPLNSRDWRFVFPSIPQGMQSRPSLEVRSQGTSTASDAVLTYLSRGLNWQMDYAITLNAEGNKLALDGLATLNNRTGVDYNDSKIMLMAGQVNQVTAAPMRKQREVMMAMADSAQSGQPREFQDYQLYSLPRTTSLLNGQTKQVSLIAADKVKADKEYHYNFSVYPRPDRNKHENRPAIKLKFLNQQQNSLGFPLPAGNARVFSPDAEGIKHFIGSARINHSAAGQEISMALGKAFDLNIKRRQTGFNKNYDSHIIAQELILSNSKSQAATIIVNSDFSQKWDIQDSNHPFDRVNASRARWNIEVPAKGEIKLSFRVKLNKP
ncbi:DUF4139 domain-containing protein [Amphritea sp. HPY]|uniref:DUF4139 domain-containing protein n=1 Tax=Amphritea sp. HPY TaxID=3421652 RepID=UPI003D7E584E